MINERKTENLIRDRLRELKYYSDPKSIIEEQKSDNLKIQKLLLNASKKGNGCGKPEFLIQYRNTELLIVIECKADITKHESEHRNKFADYAVDGVLLYASYLSKEYDVLAIAVSGQTKKELRISHFLQLKNENKPIPIFGNKILPAANYLNGYLNTPEKSHQDYNNLLDFTRKLNKKLHSCKIAESDRSLLISGILIALESSAFRKSYKDHKTPQNLANALVRTASDEFEHANITGKELEILNTQFSFIKTDTSLSSGTDTLENIIDEIDTNINSFRKTHQYYDVLGELYIEFLRYANREKGLGIVLTPPHITELFAELAQVNKNSVCYDNCCGTGGYLISAMRKMVKDANKEEKKMKAIKAKQLIGVEFQSRIFALAVSNMYIHQDGKTNITKGNCFEEKIIEKIKAKKPTVGMLNPPYPNIETDRLELEFVLNNLEILEPNSTCVAIIPMSCVISPKKKEYELKQRILDSHTLEAVLSMPNQLFYNSDVGVVTCVLVITAHKPHPRGKKTWFGYFKDDGFVVQKHKGRIETTEWDRIKQQWITAFNNREEIDGLSLIKEVTSKDEWCAEAYMETDYSKLTDKDFINELKRYAAFTIVTTE